MVDDTTNPPPKKTAKQRYEEKYPERVRESKKKYRENNRDKINDYNKRTSADAVRRATEWAENNPERRKEIEKEYRERHPESSVARSERRRARMKQAPGEFTLHDWRAALEFFGHRCAVCGRSPDMFTVLAQDHWNPIARGGHHAPYNVVPLCAAKRGAPKGTPTCNFSKGNKPPADWLNAKFGKRKARKILARIETYFKAIS